MEQAHTVQKQAYIKTRYQKIHLNTKEDKEHLCNNHS